MRKLVFEIREFHFARLHVPGHIGPGSIVTLENVDALIFATDHSLVTVRSLDMMFESADSLAYVAARGSFEGRVVRGFTAPRNAVVHSDDLVEPDVPRAVGPTNGTFLVYPRWKMRSSIPANAFDKTATGAISAYDSHVAGRFIHDTLFDALKFFDSLDRSLAQRDALGNFEGLPLPPLAVGGYFRSSTDMLTHEKAHEELLKRARAEIPRGVKRIVEGFVSTATNQQWIRGRTQIDESRTAWFNESMEQVRADVEAGFTYEVEPADGQHQISFTAGVPIVNGSVLDLSSILNLSPDQERMASIQLSEAEPDIYLQQRRP